MGSGNLRKELHNRRHHKQDQGNALTAALLAMHRAAPERGTCQECRKSASGNAAMLPQIELASFSAASRSSSLPAAAARAHGPQPPQSVDLRGVSPNGRQPALLEHGTGT